MKFHCTYNISIVVTSNYVVTALNTVVFVTYIIVDIIYTSYLEQLSLYIQKIVTQVIIHSTSFQITLLIVYNLDVIYLFSHDTSYD